MTLKTVLAAAACAAALAAQAAPAAAPAKGGSMLVRIAEIEVFPQHLAEYMKLANEVDRASMKREPGVVCLFPMHAEGRPEIVRIVEVYRSREDYAAHLKTRHFLKYKKETGHMVKDLKLNTMEPMDPSAMPLIFKKMR